MTEMKIRWQGTVTDVFDTGAGLSVTYGVVTGEDGSTEPLTTTVPAADADGRTVKVGDEMVVEQDFRDGTAVATVNGKPYCRWTGMAVRFDTDPEPA